MAKDRKKTQHSVKITAALLALIAAAVIWTIWGNTALTLTRISAESDKIPQEFDGFKIAHISDLHDAELGGDNAALIALIADEKPDIIAITGDLIDSNRTDIDRALRFARRAAELAPVYYVTGNHEGALMDYWKLKEGLETLGVTVLTDSSVTITREGAAIRIIGIDDPNFATHEEIAEGFPAMIRGKVQRLCAEDEFNLLLAHRPEHIESYIAGGAELILSGHTHGGQLRLPFIGGLIAPGQGFFPKYDAGLYEFDEAKMIISRGLGNSVIPLRFNNRPEVVSVTLKHVE